jgi:four helix bundle protein
MILVISARAFARILASMMPYERFEAWKVCDELAVQVYQVTKAFPKYELYGMTSQARRASFSAPVNIAEGSAKPGANEFCRFLNIAIGSLSELAYILRFCQRVALLREADYRRLEELRRRAGFLTWRLYEAVRKQKR